MSTILPQGRGPKITFFATHVPVWQANYAEIGMSAEGVAELAVLTAAAREAGKAQKIAQQAARAATQTYHAAVAAMTKAGGDLIKQAKTKAATEGGIGVYSKANITPPSKPAPLPPPGTPTNFAVALRQGGEIELTWTCANPAGSQGTVYTIARQIGAKGRTELLGVVGEKAFVDDTVPAGAAE